MLGHHAPPTQFWTDNLVTGEALARCPVRTLQLARETDQALLDELDHFVEVLFPAYEDGHLLESGGVDDQPARYWDLVGLVRDIRARQQAKYDELTKDEPTP